MLMHVCIFIVIRPECVLLGSLWVSIRWEPTRQGPSGKVTKEIG